MMTVLGNVKYKYDYFSVIFLLFIAVIATFHEFLSCAFSVALCIGLLLVNKEKDLIVYKNSLSVAVTVIVVMYLISCIYAVDEGMALIGFFKYLPLLLALFVFMQDENIVKNVHRGIPYLAVFMTVVSTIGMFIPATTGLFTVADRLAGFFQYPNSFALFLLVAELLLLGKDTKKYEYVMIFIIIGGILLSGSRTVWILAILANIVAFTLIRKKIKALLIGAVGVATIATIYIFFIDDGTILDRLLSFSIYESTFIGRLLYFKDALPTILKHPLGLGYMGYYYTQSSFQTGVYSVRFIHNDFLQLALDIGWIPLVLFVRAIVKSLMNKKNDLYKKLIIVVIAAHSCFDFDLQFIAIYCILISFLDIYEGSQTQVKVKKQTVSVTLIAMILINTYMGIALATNFANKNEIAVKMYPWNTSALTEVMLGQDSIDDMVPIADKLLNQNEYLVVAYSVKAREAYQHGDFHSLIQYKNHIFDLAPYQYDEYEEYCNMLITGIEMFKQKGDDENVKICENQLIVAKRKVERLGMTLSEFGKMIQDQPKTQLPKELAEYIDKVEEMY